MGAGKVILIIFAFFLYLIGVAISIGLPFVGVIPVFGDAAAAAGSVVEEFLQFIGVIILFMVGISKK